MTSTTGYDYWLLRLPAGAKQKNRGEEEQVTDELSELAERGWEPISMVQSQYGVLRFLLRRAST